MLKRTLVAALCGLAQVTFIGIASAEIIWLSEIPPSKRSSAVVKEAMPDQHAQHDHSQHSPGQKVAASGVAQTGAAAVAGGNKHQHGGGVEVDAVGEVVSDNTHSGSKQVWLRSGDDPRSASYIGGVQGSLVLKSQAGNLPEVSFSEEKGTTTARLNFPDLGFYNAYWMQQAVHDGMLHVQIAKAELLHGTCCAKAVDEEEVAKPIVNGSLPLDLVREHYPDEGLFTRITSGDTVNFTVLAQGAPVSGAKVTMISYKGWRGSEISDASGRVLFTMIRDYYPSWLEFKKRHKQTYLMTAELAVPEQVTVDGVTYQSAHYITTLAGNYYPSPHDYRSYAWGLGIALFVIVFGGLAVYLYRRRRLKPYKEERIDGKA